jgi:hypothetical protein
MDVFYSFATLLDTKFGLLSFFIKEIFKFVTKTRDVQQFKTLSLL